MGAGAALPAGCPHEESSPVTCPKHSSSPPGGTQTSRSRLRPADTAPAGLLQELCLSQPFPFAGRISFGSGCRRFSSRTSTTTARVRRATAPRWGQPGCASSGCRKVGRGQQPEGGWHCLEGETAGSGCSGVLGGARQGLWRHFALCSVCMRCCWFCCHQRGNELGQ